MVMFETFERSFLFRLTRIVAMLLIFGLLAAIVFAGAFGLVMLSLGHSSDNSVSPTEVIESIKPPTVIAPQQSDTAAAPVDQDIMPSIKMPFVLQKYFDPENLKLLRSWLNDLPENDRGDFLNEMSAAVTAAEKSKLEPIDAINKFHELKMSKLAASKANQEQRVIVLLEYIAGIIAAVIVISQLSLILVLLAVERNTRKENN